LLAVTAFGPAEVQVIVMLLVVDESVTPPVLQLQPLGLAV